MKLLYKNTPVIKEFCHNNKFYVYDTYTNSLILILKEHFVELMELKKIGISEYEKLNKGTKEYSDLILLLKKGLFKSNFIANIKHPCTELLPFLLDRSINDVTLQVTQNCNFSCRYCLYSNCNNIERHHNNSVMSWNIAKKTIDFLYDHSSDAQSINIAFYGGEPLLNFGLIKRVVEYANYKFITKNIQYSMTINGSLLKEEIDSFLIENNFLLSVSLDGPQNVQDKHRRFNSNGKGTFQSVMENLMRLKNIDETYFNRNVYYLPVVIEDEDYRVVQNFFSTMRINLDRVTPLKANMSGVDYIYSNNKNYVTVDEVLNTTQDKTITILQQKSTIPSIWHPNGQCIPGIQRLFVDVNGLFFPCEKITEDKTYSIGDINEGFDINKVCSFLNIGKLSDPECKECWAMRFCDMCISSCNDIDKHMLTKEVKLNTCKQQKELILNSLKKCVENYL